MRPFALIPNFNPFKEDIKILRRLRDVSDVAQPFFVGTTRGKIALDDICGRSRELLGKALCGITSQVSVARSGTVCNVVIVGSFATAAVSVSQSKQPPLLAHTVAVRHHWSIGAAGLLDDRCERSGERCLTLFPTFASTKHEKSVVFQV